MLIDIEHGEFGWLACLALGHNRETPSKASPCLPFLSSSKFLLLWTTSFLYLPSSASCLCSLGFGAMGPSGPFFFSSHSETLHFPWLHSPLIPSQWTPELWDPLCTPLFVGTHYSCPLCGKVIHIYNLSPSQPRGVTSAGHLTASKFGTSNTKTSVPKHPSSFHLPFSLCCLCSCRPTNQTWLCHCPDPYDNQQLVLSDLLENFFFFLHLSSFLYLHCLCLISQLDSCRGLFYSFHIRVSSLSVT